MGYVHVEEMLGENIHCSQNFSLAFPIKYCLSFFEQFVEKWHGSKVMFFKFKLSSLIYDLVQFVIFEKQKNNLFIIMNQNDFCKAKY